MGRFVCFFHLEAIGIVQIVLGGLVWVLCKYSDTLVVFHDVLIKIFECTDFRVRLR